MSGGRHGPAGARAKRRPLYSELAWAYDRVIVGPVAARCRFWEAAAFQCGVRPGASVLDAGCGTGNYALELARRGYAVTGLDVSADLIAVARDKLEGTSLRVDFQVGDILELPSELEVDGILCRGVLNDVVSDRERRGVFHSFARVLRRPGLLVLDVREWYGTVRRKQREPLFERSVATDLGRLTFRSVTRIDHETRRLLVAERHALERDGVEVVGEYDFVMRCWTREELDRNLTGAGFCAPAYYGDYDRERPAGTTDRLVAVACLKD